MPEEESVRIDPAAARLVYDEAKTAVRDLDDVLKNFRSNSTLVLGVATGAAALFAFEDSAKGLLFWLALGGYAAAAICVALIFWPIGWSHNVSYGSAQVLLGDDAEAVNETQALVDLATAYDTAYDKNSVAMVGRGGVSDRFAALIGVTAVTVLLMLANAAVEKPDQPDKPTRVVIVEE